jgi:Zn-finger nucleic acid-binding protein
MPAMKCPDCRHTLVIVEYDRLETDSCPRCGGCWLDEEELALLLHNRLQLHSDFMPPTRGRRVCPLCGVRLHVGALPGSGIEVDICPMHHGIWLDRGELSRLLRGTESGPVTGPLAEYLNEVFAEQKENSENE